MILLTYLVYDVIFGSYSLISSVVGLILIWGQMKNKPVKSIRWLYLVMIATFFWSLFLISSRMVIDINLDIKLNFVSFCFLQLMIFSAYYFHVQIIGSFKGERFLSGLILLLLGNNTFLYLDQSYLSVIRTQNSEIEVIYSPLLFVLQYLTVVIVGIIIIKGLTNVNLRFNFRDGDFQRDTIRPVAYSFFGIIIAVIITAFFLLLNGNKVGNSIFILFAGVVINFFTYVYGIHQFIRFFSPERISSVFVIDESGIPIYNKHFYIKNKTNLRMIEESTFSVAILLISINLRYRFHLTDVRKLEFEDKTMLLISKKRYIIGLVTEKESVLLDLILDSFADKVLGSLTNANYNDSNKADAIDKLLYSLLAA